MKVDLHCHTQYSPDAQRSMTEHCLSAINKGVEVVCFTDHVDWTPPFANDRTFCYDKRIKDYLECKEKFSGRLKILLGLELGEPNLFPDGYKRIIEGYEYDFILGSVHSACDKVFERQCTEKEMSVMYHERLEVLSRSTFFDSLAHLDFPKKFFKSFSMDNFVAERVLRNVIANGKSLEVNYSTLRRGLDECCPSGRILRKYLELGGKYITLGSDSHLPDDLSVPYERAVKLLPEGLVPCYYEKRQRVEYSLG